LIFFEETKEKKNVATLKGEKEKKMKRKIKIQ